MRKYIKYVLIIFMILFFLLSTSSFGTEEQYKINSYNVKINVGKNNVFEVEETITVNYPQEFYGGITMTLLKEMELTKNDGGKINKIAKVSKVQTSEEAVIQDSIDKMVIKFGNGEKAVIGNKTYSIKYTCNMGNDPYDGKDEFYFNIFNNHMNTDIYNATFEVIMPEDVDKNTLNLYSDLNNKNIEYTINGNTIKGFYIGELKAGEIVTIYMELPEGYFKTTDKKDKNLLMSLIAFSALGVLCSYLLWYKYGNDDPIVKKSKKTPPKDLNSAELGFFLKGEATNEDIITIFLSLANKGYLKVQELSEEVLFVKTKSFKVVKVKEYNGKNEYEKLFFEILFSSKNELTEQELRKILNSGIKKIEKKLESPKNVRKVFEDTGTFKGFMVLSIGILVLVLTLALPMYALYGGYGLIVSLFLVVLEMLGFAAVKSIPEYDYSKKRNLIIATALFLEFLFFISIPVAVVTQLFYFDLFYKITYCVGLICFAIILFIRKYMAKRTKFGVEILGETEGFREYLLKEKEIMKQLEKNKNYIYDMLPYVYVLGLVDEWEKMYKDLKLEKPDWYEIEEDANFETIIYFIQNLMTM